LRLDGADPLVFAVAADVLAEIRKAKSEAKRSLRTPADRVVVHDTAERLAALALAGSDLREAGKIRELATAEAAELRVEVVLAPPEP
jgi:valyl-tRNA synthetase